MSAATEAPDTPRRHLMVLAHRALAMPHLSAADVEDEVAFISAISDRDERERAFGDLMTALSSHDSDTADTVLDLLTGRPR